MGRVFASCGVALLAAVTVSAQDTTIRSETQIKADDAKVMTLTGCLAGGPSEFILNNAVTSTVAGKKDKDDDKKTVGTSGEVSSYALVSKDGLSLAPHVGHRVELVGVMVERKKGSDDDAKIQVTEKTEVEREGAPDSKVETTTKARVPRGPAPQFAVTSLKMVSPICLE